jgi:hypothetical protein
MLWDKQHFCQFDTKTDLHNLIGPRLWFSDVKSVLDPKQSLASGVFVYKQEAAVNSASVLWGRWEKTTHADRDNHTCSDPLINIIVSNPNNTRLQVMAFNFKYSLFELLLSLQTMGFIPEKNRPNSICCYWTGNDCQPLNGFIIGNTWGFRIHGNDDARTPERASFTLAPRLTGWRL